MLLIHIFLLGSLGQPLVGFDHRKSRGYGQVWSCEWDPGCSTKDAQCCISKFISPGNGKEVSDLPYFRFGSEVLETNSGFGWPSVVREVTVSDLCLRGGCWLSRVIAWRSTMDAERSSRQTKSRWSVCLGFLRGDTSSQSLPNGNQLTR